MQDFTILSAGEAYHVIEAVRDLEFRKGAWNRRLRDLVADERGKRRHARRAMAHKPTTAGIHKH